MFTFLKSKTAMICFMFFLVPVSAKAAAIPDQLLFQNIGLRQTIVIDFRVDRREPMMIKGYYRVFSHESDVPLISIQFTAKATESRNIEDCYVLEVYFVNDIIPYRRPTDVESTKWRLCRKNGVDEKGNWRLNFPIVGMDYVTDDVSVYEIELQQVGEMKYKGK